MHRDVATRSSENNTRNCTDTTGAQTFAQKTSLRFFRSARDLPQREGRKAGSEVRRTLPCGYLSIQVYFQYQTHDVHGRRLKFFRNKYFAITEGVHVVQYRALQGGLEEKETKWE